MLLLASNFLFMIFSSVLSICAMEKLNDISLSSKPPSPALEASLVALESLDAHLIATGDIGLRKRVQSYNSSVHVDEFDDAQEYELDDTEYQVARGISNGAGGSGSQSSHLHLSSVLRYLPLSMKISSNDETHSRKVIKQKDKTILDDDGVAAAGAAGAASSAGASFDVNQFTFVNKDEEDMDFSLVSLEKEKKSVKKKEREETFLSGAKQFLSDSIYGVGPAVLAQTQSQSTDTIEYGRILAALDDFCKVDIHNEKNISDILQLLDYCFAKKVKLHAVNSLRLYNYLNRVQANKISEIVRIFERFRRKINEIRKYQCMLKTTYPFYTGDEDPENIAAADLAEIILQELLPTMLPDVKRKQF